MAKGCVFFEGIRFGVIPTNLTGGQWRHFPDIMFKGTLNHAANRREGGHSQKRTSRKSEGLTSIQEASDLPLRVEHGALEAGHHLNKGCEV